MFVELITTVGSGSSGKMCSRETENPSTTLFRDYIRVETVQPNPDYKAAVDLLINEARKIDLEFCVHECVPDKPILILTWRGSDPSLSSLMLNSHMDVVPVFPQHWTHPPFSGHKDQDGNIYGRGTQDMKSVGVQHLEAVKRLKIQGKRLKRTVHLTYVPDEEVDGEHGMMGFVKTDQFKSLNVGFSMDEGMASVDDEIPLYYGERNCFWIKMTCPGSPGHGSRFLENTAAEKAQKMINKMLELRRTEKQRLESDPGLGLGDVTSVNLTMMEGGVQVNVVPDKFILGFDIRISPREDIKQFELRLRDWMKEAGEDVSMELVAPPIHQTPTSIDPTDPWFAALDSAFKKHNLNVRTRIFPAGTDSKYLRQMGLPAIGFSPMPNTPVLLHDHNEFINEDVFLKGIDIFTDVIENLANV